MSATFDTDEFAQYFRSYTRTELIPAPIIYISKGNKFNTQTFYADQLKLIREVSKKRSNLILLLFLL